MSTFHNSHELRMLSGGAGAADAISVGDRKQDEPYKDATRDEKPETGDSRSPGALSVLEYDGASEEESQPTLSGTTKNDVRDMRRMGKRQQFSRTFQSLSSLNFAVVLQATWEFLLISNTQGLVDGGLPGLFYSYIWTFVGFGFVICSLAEMASMAPTAGGQYHWVSEFAPPRHQKFLSYASGWMSVLSWQAGSASGSFLTGTIIQALITVNNESYEAKNWQGTLLVFAMVLVLFIFNVFIARELPAVQNILMMFHVGGFIAVVAILWAYAPHASSHAVFLEFVNSGGWSSMALSLMVGQISAIYGSLSSDAMAHMSEEVQDAGKTVPMAMVWAYFGNGVQALVFLIAYLYAIPSVEDALNDPTEFPFLYGFKNAMSIRGVNALTATILIVVIGSNVSFNASTSRQTFAFARDGGLPFSHWIAKVDEKRQIPTNAITLTCLISAALSLINIGSSAAFNAFISLQVSALMATSCISISCVLHRRYFHAHDRPLPYARWSLGRYGVPVNVIALLYAVFAFFWSFWPNETPVDASTFNWASVIFSAVAIVSLVLYVTRGRRQYLAPVEKVVD